MASERVSCGEVFEECDAFGVELGAALFAQAVEDLLPGQGLVIGAVGGEPENAGPYSLFAPRASGQVYSLSCASASMTAATPLEETISPARTRSATLPRGTRTTSMVSCSSGSGGAVSRTPRARNR